MVWFCNYCGKESLIGLMVDYKSTLVNSPKIICWLLISIIIWSNMLKQIIFVLLIALVFTEDICPQKLMMDCEKDAELAYQSCEKAAKEKGADQTADINCVKYILSGKKDCWPCICSIAKKQGWKIKGCALAVKIIESVLQNLQTN